MRRWPTTRAKQKPRTLFFDVDQFIPFARPQMRVASTAELSVLATAALAQSQPTLWPRRPISGSSSLERKYQQFCAEDCGCRSAILRTSSRAVCGEQAPRRARFVKSVMPAPVIDGPARNGKAARAACPGADPRSVAQMPLPLPFLSLSESSSAIGGLLRLATTKRAALHPARVFPDHCRSLIEVDLVAHLSSIS
jgi:hypothetical protein